jgi:hypothetical protein
MLHQLYGLVINNDISLPGLKPATQAKVDVQGRCISPPEILLLRLFGS